MSDNEVVSNALVEKREQFKAKQTALAGIFASSKNASGEFDLSRKDVLEQLGAKDSTEAAEKIQTMSRELNALGEEVKQANLREIAEQNANMGRVLSTPVDAARHPSGEQKNRSFGQLFIESKTYADVYRKGRQMGIPATIDIDTKTLFATGAGFLPQSVRSGLVVDAVTRPVQLLDLIPSHPIDQPIDKYMLETTRTHAAAEGLESSTYNESTFVFAEQTSVVQKITDSLPVTDEQLEDAPAIAAILDQRLRFGLRQRLDGQVFNGDGSSPNLRGLLNISGIQTQAKSTDPVFDAVFKAMTLVSVTGRAFPNALIFHPTDWQGVRLARTADGIYIMGNPSQPGPMFLFGLPVAMCDAGSAGTAVVADLLNFTYIAERRGVDVQIGYSGTQFAEGKKLLRADLRAAFTVTRPTAICKITGL